jgi:hypothetical protein
MEEKEKKAETPMNFNIDPVRTPILYADVVYIKTGDNGVTLDFCQQIGASDQFSVVSRIGISKEHAKKIVENLEALLRSEGARSTKKES